jgi:HlyD family secretion protein
MKPLQLARRIAPLLVVTAIAAAGYWLWRTGRIFKRPPPTDVVALYGNVDIRQVELGFRVPGRLTSMHFEEGQTVVAGTVLAELDTRNFEDEVRVDDAQVDALRATLKDLVAGARPSEIARAKAAVDEAAAAAKNAQINRDRTQMLADAGAIASAAVDDTFAETRIAEARLAGANQSLQLLLQGTRSEQIDAARAQLRAAQARADAARTSLADTQLIAPSDGVVISRVHEPGAIVSPVDVIYVVSLTHSVWVRAYVSESLLGRVHPGLQVDVFDDSAPSRAIKGHIGFISPTAEFTPKAVETPDLRTDLVYRLRVIIDDSDPSLRQGMPVTVKFHTGAM